MTAHPRRRKLGAMANVMITGASRGLGLEFARQYAADGWRVLACCRDPSGAESLASLVEGSGGAVTSHPLDVDDDASVARCRGEIDTAIDVLLNNAGVMEGRDAGLGDMDYPAFERSLRTNVLGPMRVAEAFHDLVARGAERKLVTISSRMGSIEEAAPNAIIYRTSKAAVNMVVRCISQILERDGIISVVLHPGWVRTDMGGPAAALSPEESAIAPRPCRFHRRSACAGRRSVR